MLGDGIDFAHLDLRRLNLFIRATVESLSRVECSPPPPPPFAPGTIATSSHFLRTRHASARSHELDAPREIACAQ